MKKKLFTMLTVAALALQVSAQPITVSKARFQKGDDMSWAKPETNDAAWGEMDMTRNWDKQGTVINDGYAWYRVHLVIPRGLLQGKELVQGNKDRKTSVCRRSMKQCKEYIRTVCCSLPNNWLKSRTVLWRPQDIPPIGCLGRIYRPTLKRV